jgi:hypothetical protein
MIGPRRLRAKNLWVTHAKGMTMNRSYKLPVQSVILSALCILLSSCQQGGVYVPPSAPHTYTTDTQTQHTLTGLRIGCRSVGVLRDGGGDTIIGQMIGAPDKLEYYIDGRLVATNNPSTNLDTFLELPPGEHRLLVQYVGGPVALRYRRWEYDFTLSSGQRGTFSSEVDNKGEYKVNGFTDVSSSSPVAD